MASVAEAHLRIESDLILEMALGRVQYSLQPRGILGDPACLTPSRDGLGAKTLLQKRSGARKRVLGLSRLKTASERALVYTRQRGHASNGDTERPVGLKLELGRIR